MYISSSNKYATYNPYQPWHPPSLPDPLWSKFPLIPYSFFFHRETATVVFNRSDAGEKMQVKKYGSCNAALRLWMHTAQWKSCTDLLTIRKVRRSAEESERSLLSFAQKARSLQFAMRSMDSAQQTILAVSRWQGRILAVCNAVDGFRRFVAQRTILVISRWEGTILAVCNIDQLAIGHLGGIDPYAVKASKIISSLLDVDAEIKDVNFERPTYNKSSNVVNSKHDRSLQFGIHVNDWQDSQNCNIEQRMILVVIRSEGTILVDLPVLGGLARFAAVHRQRTILVVVRSEGTILATRRIRKYVGVHRQRTILVVICSEGTILAVNNHPEHS